MLNLMLAKRIYTEYLFFDHRLHFEVGFNIKKLVTLLCKLIYKIIKQGNAINGECMFYNQITGR